MPCRVLALALLVAGCGTDSPAPAVAPGAELPRTPERRALRRLNRSEYDRTVRDLLGTDSQPARDFPSDDSSHGFDNAADALTLSPLHLESYELAASRLAKEILDEPLAAPIDVDLDPSGTVWGSTEPCNAPFNGGFGFWCGGEISRTISIPESGTYRLSASVYGSPAGEEAPHVRLGADGETVATLDVSATAATSAESLTVDLLLTEGRHTLFISFDNDYFDPITSDDRNLFLTAASLEGPVDFIPRPNPAWDKIMTCELAGARARACAEQILASLAPRAWRRPLVPGDLEGLMALYDQITAAGDPPEWGLEIAIRALLTSPHFLFHVEEITEPGAPVSPANLANRLSYLLWSSMPDDPLFALATDGTLTDPKVLAEQVRRMLRDPRAEALTADFAGQWLYIRAVDDAFPDPWYFPEFTPGLQASMKGEMESFFSSFVGTDRSLRELLVSEWGYIDNNLATFYGIETAPRADFFSYNLENVGRGGWLRQAGLLTALANPTRSNPVRRGVWVLGHLLCDEPDPPPPGVEGLDTQEVAATTLRERLEAHRESPACAACHNDIDPIGLSFEHYDGIGSWRDLDEGQPVDATGELPDGTTFDGIGELAPILADDPRFSRCIVDRAFTYALGREPADDEEGILYDIHRDFVAGGMTMDALMIGLVTSPTFLTAGGAP